MTKDGLKSIEVDVHCLWVLNTIISTIKIDQTILLVCQKSILDHEISGLHFVFSTFALEGEPTNWKESII